MKFNPELLAEWLTEAWGEMGGQPELASPLAWLAVCEKLQLRIMQHTLSEAARAGAYHRPTGLNDYNRAHLAQILGDDGRRFNDFSAHLLRLINRADLDNRRALKLVYPEHVAAYEQWEAGIDADAQAFLKPGGNDPAKLLGLARLSDAIRDGDPEVEECDVPPLPADVALHVATKSTGPPLPLAGATLVLPIGWTVPDLMHGYYPESAAVYEPDDETIRHVRVGRPLLPMIPLRLKDDRYLPDAEESATLHGCRFCQRKGILDDRQLKVFADAGGLPICVVCLPRLVGSTWVDAAREQQAGKAADEHQHGDRAGAQAKDSPARPGAD